MISNNLIKSIITGIVVIFCLVFYSCIDNSAEEIARFKSEYRDPRLIGKWINLNFETNQRENIYKLLKKSGEYIVIEGDETEEDVKQSNRLSYFYTKDDSFYTLDPGDGIKIGLNIIECKYKLSKDTLTVSGKTGAIYFKALKVSDIAE